MITTNQFRNGMTIQLEDHLFEIVEFQHVKPGKGAAFVRSRLKNLKTGAVVDKTFRAGEKVELAHLNHKNMQYLYNDGSNFVFMDSETYEQFPLSQAQIGKAAKFIKEGSQVSVSFYEGKPVLIKPPTFIELKVTKAEPGLKGDTATAGTKKVTLETGLSLQVPLFINQGDVVKVDTRTGQYLGKVGNK